MDAVIPYQHHGKGFELRYALRSLQQHFAGLRTVWIVGDELPLWAKGLNLIHFKEKHGNIRDKERNIYEKTNAACDDIRVSDDFLFANDDHFLLQGFNEDFPEYYHDLLKGTSEKAEGYYKETLVNTRGLLNHWAKDFDCHCPIVYNKVLYKQSIGRLNWQKSYGYAIKTVYCNTWGIEGEYMQDCKIRKAPETRAELDELLAGRAWFSTCDYTARNAEVRKKIMELYPEPSRYENLEYDASRI